MFAVTLVILLAQGAGAAEYAHGSVSPWTGEIVPMDIELHNKTMLTYPGTPDPAIGCYKKTINFHDFTRGLVALKPVGKKTCFIKTSDETYEEMKKVVDRINSGNEAPKLQATEEWLVPKTPLPTGEVIKRVGNRIANFCTGCTVYILQDGKVTREASDVPRVTRRGSDDSTNNMSRLSKRGGWCLLCFTCKISGRR